MCVSAGLFEKGKEIMLQFVKLEKKYEPLLVDMMEEWVSDRRKDYSICNP